MWGRGDRNSIYPLSQTNPTVNVELGTFIEVVKKTFRYTNVFLLQPLMPPFLIPEHKYGKRYKPHFLSRSAINS